MYPQAFLKTFWQLERKRIVFVAMPFSADYEKRYEHVIAPAIKSLEIDDEQLEPYRVDISKTGDSILTDILDGIAHCQLFLADISTVGKDSKTGDAYRNGNVMYEVGLALACRHSSEILLVRDDHDKFLFDLSTIPTKTIDFTNTKRAETELQAALKDRLKEQNFINDARLEMVVGRISTEEFNEIEFAASLPDGTAWGGHHKPYLGTHEMAISRLLDKQVVKMVGVFKNGKPAYRLTPLGQKLAQHATGPKVLVEDILPSTKQRK